MRKKIILIVADISMIVFMYFVAFILRFELEGSLNYVHFIYTSLPIIIVVTIPVFIRMGMYNSVWRYASVDSLVMVIKAVTFSVLISVVLVFFIETYRMPRSIFIIYWLLFLVGTGGVRFSTRFYRYYFVLKRGKGRRVLIYGAGSAGQMVAKEMRYDYSLGFSPICFVDDDLNKIGKRMHNLPIYSGVADLDEIISVNMVLKMY